MSKTVRPGSLTRRSRRRAQASRWACSTPRCGVPVSRLPRTHPSPRRKRDTPSLPGCPRTRTGRHAVVRVAVRRVVDVTANDASHFFIGYPLGATFPVRPSSYLDELLAGRPQMGQEAGGSSPGGCSRRSYTSTFSSAGSCGMICAHLHQGGALRNPQTAAASSRSRTSRRTWRPRGLSGPTVIGSARSPCSASCGDGDRFHRVAGEPPAPDRPRASAVNGITDAMVAGAPPSRTCCRKSSTSCRRSARLPQRAVRPVVPSERGAARGGAWPGNR